MYKKHRTSGLLTQLEARNSGKLRSFSKSEFFEKYSSVVSNLSFQLQPF